MRQRRFDFNAEELLCAALLVMGLLALVFIWAILLMINEQWTINS